MSSFFSVDSPLYKFMTRLTDIFKLNCMWLLCSLPIVTMGAATTAAYTITLKMVKDEEGYIAGPFWEAFKANLKQGSILGVIQLVACYALYLDFQFFHAVKEHNTWYLVIGVVGAYLVLMHLVYAFPLMAKYENTIIGTMRNSYSIGAKFLGRTAFLAGLLVLEMCIILWNLTTMFAGLLIGPACIMLTISGFADSFFTVIERENLMSGIDASADTEDFESADQTEGSEETDLSVKQEVSGEDDLLEDEGDSEDSEETE